MREHGGFMRLAARGSLILSLLALASSAQAAAPVDPGTVNRIADASFNHGQVVETAAYLADRIGGRMTKLPSMRVAERWAMEQFKGWGLKNVHPQGLDFCRRWGVEYSYLRLKGPRPPGLPA